MPMVARSLAIPTSQAREMARELSEEGLVRISVGQVELAPMSIDDRLAIADLASWYDQHRSLVLQVLRAMGRFDA